MRCAGWQPEPDAHPYAGSQPGPRSNHRGAGPAIQARPEDFVYADVDSNIGYQAAGRLPIRKTFDGSVPVDGDGRLRMAGLHTLRADAARLQPTFRPYRHPPNQNPFPESPYRIGGNFSAPSRAEQIRQLLSKPRLEGGTDWPPCSGTVSPRFSAMPPADRNWPSVPASRGRGPHLIATIRHGFPEVRCHFLPRWR